MPIYEYACESCGHDFEKLQKVSAPMPACPQCEGAEVRKRVSKTSFHLKGTGWYVTDYKSDKSAGADSDAASAKTDAKNETSKSDSAGESKPKTDSKPATKPESKPAPSSSTATKDA